MTPEPRLELLRLRGWSGSSKKWRKNGSRIKGCWATSISVLVEMLTTAGVVRFSIGARLGSGVPSTLSGHAAFANGVARARAAARQKQVKRLPVKAVYRI